ncbi:MAG TPA: pantoate--beta-alanine ligase [Humisphaera sp.]
MARTMQVLTTIAEVRAARAKLGRLALVPTMGALHAGHLSLIDLARRRAPHVAVSIFVNPTQFGHNEDFNRYPRPLEDDLAKCRTNGVDLVFAPAVEEMYPPQSVDCVVDLPLLSGVLEGKHRPGHFKGVCQVVAKLFNIVRPDAAVFGQKDYQQLRIIEAMTEALDLNVEIIPGPTVRDLDGLAMSSRNVYLKPDEREKALAINRALAAAQAEFAAGVRQANRLLTTVQKTILEKHLMIDYVAAVDAKTLKHTDTVTQPTVIAVAIRVGKTRLIDNLLLEP